MRRRKFRQKVRQMNLDVKLRLYITMMIVGITGVMLLISTTFTVHSLYQKSIDAAHSKLGFITQSYGDWLDGNKNMMMAFQMDSNIQSFCSYKTKGAERYSVSINKVKESIENQLNQNMDMNFISVTNQEIGSYVYGGNHSVTNTRYEEAFHKGLEESQPARRKGSMRVNFGTEFFGGSKYSVTFYQPVYSTAHLDDPIGMLCVNVNDSLLEKMEESLDIKSYQTYLSDLQGNCISVMSKEKISGGSEPLSFEGKKSGELYHSGNFYYFQKIKDWNYYVVSVVPLSELFQSSFEAAMLMLLVMMAVLAASIVVVRTMVNKNYEQIATVIQAMDHLSNNDLEYRIQTEKLLPDLQKLAKGFNSMADDINKLMVTVRKEQHQMDQIRFQALQSQIQPHFSYNTLECIHWQSMVEGEKKVSKLIMALASYYRLALSKGRDVVSLKQELEHIKYYLMIQNQRYGDMISYEIHVDESFYEVKIPKLTLQPLVENSIYHGIRVKEGVKGSIQIGARREGETILLEVVDSGEGMTRQQVMEMNQSISNYDESFGYGVRNVNKRIQLRFGTQYGLTYGLNEHGGITVWITLPAEFEEEEEVI